MTVRQIFFLLAFAIPASILALGWVWPAAYWMFIVVVPLVLIGLIDCFQTRHTVRRLYPVVGRIRYLFESVRPEIQQYFVESETDGIEEGGR